VNNGKRLERFSQSQKDSSIKFVKIDPYMITTLCFNFSMIIIWLTFVISAFQNKANKNLYADAGEEWTKCYFLNYGDGSTDLKSICGELPKKHPNFNELKWVMFCYCGKLIILGCTYLICSLIRYFLVDKFVYVNAKNEDEVLPAEDIHDDKADVDTPNNTRHIDTSASEKSHTAPNDVAIALEVELV
jgi:hypothetical protein